MKGSGDRRVEYGIESREILVIMPVGAPGAFSVGIHSADGSATRLSTTSLRPCLRLRSGRAVAEDLVSSLPTWVGRASVISTSCQSGLRWVGGTG